LSVNGILLGRAVNRQADLIRRYEADSRRLTLVEQRQRMAGRWLRALVQLTFTVTPILIYWYAGDRQATGDRSLSLGTIVAFATMQSRLLPPVVTLLSLNTSVGVALTLLARVFQYLDLRSDVAEGKHALPRGRRTRHALSMRAVSFAYPGRREWTLSEVDLEIEHGEHVAVVGSTGSGKTTLGYLLARYYDPQRGRVCLDGTDLRELRGESLANHLGFVPQEPFLLHDSVANNLRFAQPGATDEQLWWVLALACIDKRITDLPDGLHTLVGSRGYRFSGGEKQRLALARALLRRTPVLVLDEATSALDPDTEERVYDNLRQALAGTTLVTITHRPELAERADLTVVLAGGRVSGVHHGGRVSRHGHR
jgi:ATP-binding cassette subfamily B protein